MKKIYNKFLIISTLALFVGGSYLYFSDGIIKEGITPVAFGSSLASSNGGASQLPTSQDSQIASDISFLTTLVALKNIKIDSDFFSDKSFQLLKNNKVTIEQVKSGRPNPFGPIENVNNNNNPTSNTSRVITEQSSQVTKSSAILNGSVNIASETAPTYFEYSLNPQVSNSTVVSTKQSLLGTFIKNISGLIPQTTYYYKACVKINNVATCGEILSFTTLSS